MSIEKIGNVLGNKSFAKLATGTAGTVYVMTGIKALARPYFIYTDKTTNDKKTKQYAATSEFLYQLLCLGLTVAMVPFFKTGGLKMAEKYLKKNPEASKILDEISRKIFLPNQMLLKLNLKKLKKLLPKHLNQTFKKQWK